MLLLSLTENNMTLTTHYFVLFKYKPLSKKALNFASHSYSD